MRSPSTTFFSHAVATAARLTPESRLKTRFNPGIGSTAGLAPVVGARPHDFSVHKRWNPVIESGSPFPNDHHKVRKPLFKRIFISLLLSLFLIGCGGDRSPGGVPPPTGENPGAPSGESPEAPVGDTSGTPTGDASANGNTDRSANPGGNAGSGGTETGNSAATVTIRVVGYRSSELISPSVDTLAIEGNEIDAAWIVLDRLRFVPFGADSEEGIVEFGGPFIVNLVDPSPIAGLENLEIPPGRYSRLRLTFKKLPPDSSPAEIGPDDPLLNRSLLVTGSRVDEMPFEVSTETNLEFQLRNETNGFEINSRNTATVLMIAFDLDHLLDGVDLDDETVEVSTQENGESIVYVNNRHNQGIHQRIEQNLKLSADLFEDKGNDELDPDEASRSLASGSSAP